MKKTLFALAVVSAAALGVNAEVLDAQAALARAMADGPMRITSKENTPVLAFTENVRGLPAAYIFNSPSGYFVVSADDVAPAILGYSDQQFDSENIPENLAYWLGEYARQIEWARDNGVDQPAFYARPERASISPILTTTWDQGSPYNNMCPTYNDNGARCITGCVATAMAQVMKAHNWPDVGEGRRTYVASAIGQTLAINFERCEFDWDNMLDHYRNQGNDTQKDAVALLMKACGYSVDMGYTSGACGAYSIDVAKALPKYFKYDKGLVYALRDFWGLLEWEEMIYDELKDGRPVYLAGANKDAGHAFVCDGYSQDGYFHINWGWNGTSNGYFLLTGLDPSQQGLGGSAAGYNSWQEALINVKPRNEENPADYSAWMGLYDFNFAKSQYSLGEYAEVTSYAYNYCMNKLSGTWGLKLVPTEGGEPIYLKDGSEFSNVSPQYGVAGSVLLPSDLAEGEYTLTPGWVDARDGQWNDSRIVIYQPQSYTLTVSGSKAVLKANPTAKIEFSDVEHNNIFVNGRFIASAKITNTGDNDYYKRVHPSVQNASGKEILAGEELLLNIIGQDVVDFAYKGTLSLVEGQTANPDNKYYFYFRDNDGKNLTPAEEVAIKPETATEVEVIFNFGDGEANEIDINDVKFDTSITCKAGFFSETPVLWILSTMGDKLQGFTGEETTLEEGETKNYVFTGTNSSMKEGRKYYAYIKAGNTWIGTKTSFRAITTTSIESVEADQAVSTAYYNLQGVEIKSELANGRFCIVVTKYADGSSKAETKLVK